MLPHRLMQCELPTVQM